MKRVVTGRLLCIQKAHQTIGELYWVNCLSLQTGAVDYDGKKDKALTRKAQNALAFSKRFDEIMGNKTSLYDMDKKYQEAYFEKLEEGVKKYKDDEKSSKESKN